MAEPARDKTNIVSGKRRGRPPKATSARDSDRQAAVAAALGLLAAGGSRALTARGVADRVGVSLGSIYALFGSLEALKLEANAVTMRRLRARLVEALAACRGRSVEERLLCLADAYSAFARDNHHAWAAVFEPITIEPLPGIADDIAALFAVIEEVLGAVPSLGPDQIPVVAKALWSSVHGMVYLGEIGSLGPIGREDVPGMIETLVRAAVRGLGTRPLSPRP